MNYVYKPHFANIQERIPMILQHRHCIIVAAYIAYKIIANYMKCIISKCNGIITKCINFSIST